MRSATRSQLALHASASVRSTVSVVSALSARSSVRSSAGSSSSSSTKRVHRSSNASCDAMSSSTSMPRREPGFDRVLGQESLRERVQRRHRGAVELLEGDRRLRRAAATVSAPRAVASSARRIRSRSSAAAFSVKVTAAISRMGTSRRDDQRDDPVDQGLGLARSRARFDEERLVERFDDRGARGEVLVEIEEALLHRSPSCATTVEVAVAAELVERAPARRAARSRAAPAPSRFRVATRGSGRACRGRRGRCSCGTGAPRCSAGRPGRGTRRRRCRRRWRAARRRPARRPPA